VAWHLILEAAGQQRAGETFDHFQIGEKKVGMNN